MANWIHREFERKLLPGLPGACQIVIYETRPRRRAPRISLLLIVGVTAAIAALTAAGCC